MNPSEMLRRTRVVDGAYRWSVPIEEGHRENSIKAIQFLEKADYDIDRAIKLAEAEEGMNLDDVLEPWISTPSPPMNKEQLIRYCWERGLDSSGTVEELRKRIREYLEDIVENPKILQWLLMKHSYTEAVP